MTIRKISKRRSAAGEVYSIKRSRPKPKKRSAKEFRRIYGSKARVIFVCNLPCAACGVVGWSQNAHVAGESGVGYKADAKFIAPLCGPRWATAGYLIPGCHTLYDQSRSNFDRKCPDFNPEKASADCEAAWLSFSGGSPKTGDGT